jgi:integrase
VKNSKNPNHPAKGSSIKVEPIRDRAAIKRIKKLLDNNPRNLALFTLGINVAFRANELVALNVNDIDHLSVGDVLDHKQKKTKKYRAVIINQTVHKAIQDWLAVRPESDSPALFPSQRGERLTVPSIHLLVKTWCKNVGLRGNYGSHTLRKTWGFMQRESGVSETLISEAYGHASVAITRSYLGVQSEEVKSLYEMMEL